MSASPAELELELEAELRAVARRHRRAAAAAERAEIDRAEAIARALEAGLPGARVARLVGVSRQRVHQLRP